MDAVLTRAAVADEVGIDRVLAVDHVVMGDNIDAYDGGTFPTGPGGLWLEPLTVLSAVAATTRRVRLATGILIAPLRRTPALAKAAATLDVISGGRLELGVGVGWQREEYDVSGVRFEERGQELDRTLELCRALWRGAASPEDDLAVAAGVAGIWCEPRPLQPGGVPLWVSGRIHARTLRRIVRFGDGWIPWGERHAILPGLRMVHEALAAAGRDPAGFQVRGTLPVRFDRSGVVDAEQTVAPVPDQIAAGVTDFALATAVPSDRQALVDLLVPLVAAFTEVTGRPAPTLSAEGAS